MQQIRVWDPLVRVLHWTLVFCVVSNFLNESGEDLHQILGLIAAAAVTLRFIWGFIGPQYARFSDWFPTPQKLIPYVKALLKNKAPRHIGHNPAGAVMMLVLMAIVITLAVSGYVYVNILDDDWIMELHEVMSNVLIAAVIAHVSAAIFESWKHKENLIASMIHGKKAANDSSAESKNDQAP